jgi:hypothetical protein
MRYEIYHASFRQVLKAEHPGQPGMATGLPSALQALAGELGAATTAAHSRIADTYLTSFGGLPAGLPALAADPAAGGADGGYPLRHLARHLDHANRHAELHQLLAAGQPASDGRTLNVWFSAHDTASTVASYLDDLTRARHLAAADTDRALAARQLAPSLGTEIRYALMTASIISRTTGISPELLSQLVQTRTWTPERGLDHARRLTDPHSRLNALLAICPHAPAATQRTITDAALDAATAISDETYRASALTRLAPHLPPDQLTRALDAATAISNDYYRARTLTSLAPHLPPDQLTTTMSAIPADQPGAVVGLSSKRCNFLLCCYLRPALRRPSKVMSKALRAAFHRLVHRLRPLPVGSRLMIAR